jgi:hypothetical protein
VQVTYDGKTRFVATDRTPQSVALTLECSEPLPASTEVCVVLGRNYRGLSAGRWELEGVEVEGSGAVRQRHGLPGTFQERWDYTLEPGFIRLCTYEVTDPVAAGAAVSFALRGTLSTMAANDAVIEVRTRRPERERPDEEPFTRVDERIPLRSVAGEPTALEVRPSPVVLQDAETDLSLFAVDDLYNPVRSYTGTLTLDADGTLDGLPETVTITDEGDGRATVGDVRLPDGTETPVRIAARDEHAGIEGSSPPIVRDEGDDSYLFGGIHFHTADSHDGDRTLEQAYTYARDWLNLDFAAATDHRPGAAAFRKQIAVADDFDEAGRFATIPAWEWSAERGHVNVYLRTDTEAASPAVADAPDEPTFGQFDDAKPSFYDVDGPDDAVVVPHHTNAASAALREDGQPYWRQFDWSRPVDRTRLVEVVQSRGSFETDENDEEWDVRYGGNGASVRDALEQEDRLGFVAGTDNHEGYPTRGMERGYAGLTCVRASERSRAAVWRALERRATYATSGVPIVCDFAVGGTRFGGETTVAPGEDPAIRADLHGTAPIERVEVISAGDNVWAATPGALDVSIREPLPAPDSGETYYYLRLRQADGHRAWLSPVWVEVDG